MHLVRNHILFDHPDPWMVVNGMGRDWPDARGFYFDQNKTTIAWVNEEDHLAVIGLSHGTDFAAVFGAHPTCVVVGV